jgi:hypothetical protein
MVNLISNEPKTGCYLLPILSNLQALKEGVQEFGSYRSSGAAVDTDGPIPLFGALFCLQWDALPHPELLNS